MFLLEKKDKIFILTAIFCVFGALSYLFYKFSGINAAQYSIFYIVLFIGISYILKNRLLLKNTCVGEKWDWILGAFLSTTTVTGIYFDQGLPYETMGNDAIGYIICIVFITPLFSICSTNL